MSDSDTVKVFVEEEYGYRYWMWDTGMTPEALIAWWQALDTVHKYFFSPASLPGRMTEIAVANRRDPSRKDYEAFFAALDAARLVAQGWDLHIHQDNDSDLRHDGTTYTHAGFVPLNHIRESV
jgi:hypothetical protein